MTKNITKNLNLIDYEGKSNYIDKKFKRQYISYDNMLFDTIRLYNRSWVAGHTNLETADEKFKKYRFLDGSDNIKDVVAISLYGTKDWKTSNNSYLRTNFGCINHDFRLYPNDTHIFSIDVLPNKLRCTKGVEKGWYYLQIELFYHDNISDELFSKYYRFGQNYYPHEGCWKRLYLIADSDFIKNDKYGKANIDYDNYELDVTEIEISLSFWDADNPNDVLDYGDFYVRKPMLTKSEFKTDYFPSFFDFIAEDLYINNDDNSDNRVSAI